MKDAVPTYPMVALGAGLAVMIVIVLASHKLSSRGIYASFLGWGALCSVVLWAPVWLAYSFQQIYPRAILLAALFSTAFLVVFRKSARALKIGLPGILWIQVRECLFMHGASTHLYRVRHQLFALVLSRSTLVQRRCLLVHFRAPC